MRERELYEELFSLREPFDVQAGLREERFVCAPAAAGRLYEESALRLMYVGRDLAGWQNMQGETPSEMAEFPISGTMTRSRSTLTCAWSCSGRR